MRSAFTGIWIAVLIHATSTAGLAPTNTRRTSLNKLTQRSAADPASLPRTNAKRFAMGLPPLKPRLFDPLHPAPARRSATPSLSYSVDCNIHVKESTLFGEDYGYLTTEADSGRYGKVQMTGTDALVASFSYSVVDQLLSSDPFDLTVTNSAFPSYPYFGAVGAVSTLDSQSSHFVFLGATSQTPAGADAFTATGVASEYEEETSINVGVESAIWTYSPLSSILTPHWVNPSGSDSTDPNTIVGYIPSMSLLILTGSIDEFNAMYGDNTATNAQATEVKLTCDQVAERIN